MSWTSKAAASAALVLFALTVLASPGCGSWIRFETGQAQFIHARALLLWGEFEALYKESKGILLGAVEAKRVFTPGETKRLSDIGARLDQIRLEVLALYEQGRRLVHVDDSLSHVMSLLELLLEAV